MYAVALDLRIFANSVSVAWRRVPFPWGRALFLGHGSRWAQHPGSTQACVLLCVWAMCAVLDNCCLLPPSAHGTLLPWDTLMQSTGLCGQLARLLSFKGEASSTADPTFSRRRQELKVQVWGGLPGGSHLQLSESRQKD